MFSSSTCKNGQDDLLSVHAPAGQQLSSCEAKNENPLQSPIYFTRQCLPVSRLCCWLDVHLHSCWMLAWNGLAGCCSSRLVGQSTVELTLLLIASHSARFMNLPAEWPIDQLFKSHAGGIACAGAQAQLNRHVSSHGLGNRVSLPADSHITSYVKIQHSTSSLMPVCLEFESFLGEGSTHDSMHFGCLPVSLILKFSEI